ncbi:MAG: SRPBCC family protein [Chloroflexota bacterium]
MPLLPQPKPYRGAVIDKKLGEALLQEIAAGNTAALEDAIKRLTSGEKEQRLNAARLIQRVAATYPQRAAPFLTRLLPALDLPEAQTRWMIMHALRLCAAANPEGALAALPKAQQIIRTKSGVTLWNATVVYLGYVGATSAENARRVLPLIEQALRELPQLTKATLESYARLLDVADIPTMIHISQEAARYIGSDQPGVRSIANKIVRRVAECGLTPANAASTLALHLATFARVRPEVVYNAWTTAKGLESWLALNAFVDARPGGSIQLRLAAWGTHQDTLEEGGPVVEAEPAKRLVFKWHPHSEGNTTTVQVTLQATEDGTSLHLIENGFEDSPAGRQALTACSSSWNEALGRLKRHLERQEKRPEN